VDADAVGGIPATASFDQTSAIAEVGLEPAVTPSRVAILSHPGKPDGGANSPGHYDGKRRQSDRG